MPVIGFKRADPSMTQTTYPSSGQYKRQLRGWLSYAFASEVFVIVSLTLFLPICLEQFARDNGFLQPDRTEPCSSLEITTTSESTCVVKIGWIWVDSASFSLYVYSISVALQALTVISMGGIADHSPHRKRLLLLFAALGSCAATLFLALPSSSSLWLLSALLAICANVGFGASVVAMNAYLPALAREAPDVIEIRAELQNLAQDDLPSSDDHDQDEPLLPRGTTLTAKYDIALSAATSRISSMGIALGYGAGILMLVIALVPVTLLHGSTFSLRLAIGLSGIWWALFSIPAAMWLPSGSTSPEDVIRREDRIAREWNVWREVKAAWMRLGGMLKWKEVKRLRNTFQYLAAWFLLSDGFTTITSTAILFGKTTLHMPPSSLILIGILTPLSGIIGSLIWPVLQRRYIWSNLKVLVILVVMASAIPAYGCLGFLPILKKWGKGGLTTPGEMFGLAVYFGSVYGAFQSYARAFYAELIPTGEEARWYGLFSITDKSSSFLGPLIVGLIADATGNIRYAFFFLVGMVWAAVPILMSVSVERGREDARGYVYVGGGGESGMVYERVREEERD